MQIYSEFHAHNIAEQEASWRQKYSKQPINCIKQWLPVVVRQCRVPKNFAMIPKKKKKKKKKDKKFGN